MKLRCNPTVRGSASVERVDVYSRVASLSSLLCPGSTTTVNEALVFCYEQAADLRELGGMQAPSLDLHGAPEHPSGLVSVVEVA